MRRLTISWFVWLICLMLLELHASAQVIQRVVDGDTLVVAGIGTVRLIGIDTPETVEPRKPIERFGKEAASFLREMVQGKTVRLDYDVARRDKYRRTLAYVYLADGTFVNAEMVRQGYAHAYVAFPFRHLQQFLEFEREAREAGRGLWNGQSVTSQTVLSGAPLSADQTVYVTRTGDHYHRATCPTLARSRIAVPLKDAVSHYKPCRVCKPPTVTTK